MCPTMVLKGVCLCVGAARQGAHTCGCCHSCLQTGGVAATATTTATGTTTTTVGSMGQLCGGVACCRRLMCCCSRGVVGAGGGGQGSCISLTLGKLPCCKVCPRITTYSAISLIGLTTFLLFQQEVELILGWLLESGDAESFLVFLILFTFLSFPMTWGYILVNIVAGYRFGPAFGTCVVVISVAIGSACAFLVCRTLLSSVIRNKLMNDKLEVIVQVVESEHGFQVIALTRLTPIPFGIQNGVFALSKVPAPTFMMASFIGLIPTQFLNSYMGSTLRSVQDIKEQQSSSAFLIAQVFISFFLSVYVIKVAQRALHRKLDKHHGELSDSAQHEGDTPITSEPTSPRLKDTEHGLLNGNACKHIDSTCSEHPCHAVYVV